VSERRERVFWLGESEILFVLAGWQNQGYFTRPKPGQQSVPDGAKVVSVCADWSRRCIGVLLSHPSFPPVPDGAPTPVCSDRIEWEYVDAKAVLYDAVKRLDVKPGDALVLGEPRQGAFDAGLRMSLADSLLKEFLESTFIFLPAGYSLAAVDEETMRRAGWVRAARPECAAPQAAAPRKPYWQQ
jgi:hypothetical protein